MPGDAGLRRSGAGSGDFTWLAVSDRRSKTSRREKQLLFKVICATPKRRHLQFDYLLMVLRE